MLVFFHRRVLFWMSAIGLAITVVGAIEPILQIANFIHVIVERWREFSQIFWDAVFSIVGAKPNFLVVSLLNAGCFVAGLELSVAGVPRRPASFRSMLLILINNILIGAIFLLIVISPGRIAPIGEPLLPNPAQLSNWLDSRNWLPLGVYVFAFTGLQSAAMSEPYTIFRRLLDVICVLIVVLAFNYLAVFAPSVAAFFKG